LDPREFDVENLSKRAGGESLRETREVLDEDMTVAEEREEYQCEGISFAYNRTLDFFENPIRALGDFLHRQHLRGSRAPR
jgi:hypothetical protein